MKNKILALIFIGFLTLASFSFASATTFLVHGDDTCCCCSSKCMKMCVMDCEDLEYNVENIKDGVVVKITSKNEEVVKKIQERCAKMEELCAKKECCKEEGTKKDKVKK